MKVYILIDHSRWCSPVRGVYSCAVDAAEAKKQFPNTSVVDYLVNSGDEPCEHVYEADDRFENERRTNTCKKCGDVR